MSTLMHDTTRPATGCAPRQRIITGQLALVFVVVFGTLTSFYLMLSVTPRYAADAGAGTAGAGLATGALLAGTVAAELASSHLLRRCGYRALLAASALLLGLPALALLSADGLAVIVAASVIRGFGFGLSTVVTGAAIAELLPADRRGEGLGLTGVVDMLPAVLALPAGVWLAEHYGNALVVGMTVAAALLPVAALPWLPRVFRRAAGAAEVPAADPPAIGLLAGLRRYGQLKPALIFAATTVAAGIVVSFLPLAVGIATNIVAIGLLAQAVAAALSQLGAGRYGDRHGHTTLLVPGLGLASLGMLAMIWLTSPIALIAAMCVFGTGFGILQNATFALMIDRMPATGLGTASALWNLAYDVGYGAGPAGFGLVVSHVGYPAAFAITGALMLIALPAAASERAAHRRGARHLGSGTRGSASLRNASTSPANSA